MFDRVFGEPNAHSEDRPCDQAGYCLHEPLRELIAGRVHFTSKIDDGCRDRLEAPPSAPVTIWLRIPKLYSFATAATAQPPIAPAMISMTRLVNVQVIAAFFCSLASLMVRLADSRAPLVPVRWKGRIVLAGLHSSP